MTRSFIAALALLLVSVSAPAQSPTVTVTLTPTQVRAIDADLVNNPLPVVPDAPALTRAQARAKWVERELTRILAPTERQLAAERAADVDAKLAKLAPARCRAVAKELGVDESVCGG